MMLYFGIVHQKSNCKMKFEKALKAVETLALRILTTPGGELAAVGVTSKNGGSIIGATDFAVTAFVPKKLTTDELKDKDIRSFQKTFEIANKGTPFEEEDIDLDVVASGSYFNLMAGLSSPASLRGMYGGNLPSIDTRKPFSSLRMGIGIANPKGKYPDLLDVGTLGFFVKDDSGNQYLVSKQSCYWKLQ
jgi:hypothetical protein